MASLAAARLAARLSLPRRKLSSLGSALPRGPGAKPYRPLVLTLADEQATSVRVAEWRSPPLARRLRVCLIGPTNAGKSTLLNALLDFNVSAVSNKIHTTRENTVGFMTDEPMRTQVEFIDAPGACGPVVPVIGRQMWDAVRSADLALVMVDASSPGHSKQISSFLEQLSKELLEWKELTGHTTETALVLNKVDRVFPKSKLLQLSARLHSLHPFDAPCFMISALLGSGTKHLREYLLLAAKPGEWTAPPDKKHLQSPLQLATEVIRSQVFNFFHDELPYAIMQRNIAWTELHNGVLRIDQQLIVPKGKGVQRIVSKRLPGVAVASRKLLSQVLERRVQLELSVATERPNDRLTNDEFLL
ncbi:hypothetical protein AB1Y20_022797 [Prymnesium parvum]|uniref:G domain-containing protein n=1 Tax=Prymnesium parvum TaxID=97485 RepID=A0AB34JDW5_PRYPA